MMSAVHFGVATADHQCEAFDPRYPDIRDEWEKLAGQTPRGQATDFWNRYQEDVRLAAGLGCTMFRISLSWARIEPEPGVFNQEALDHYRDVVRAIKEAGMEPMVTLMHYVWPLHIDLLDERFPRRFHAYAEKVAKELGRDVRWWITINEPTELVFGFLKPWWQHAYRMPPGLSADATSHEQMESCARLMRNLFRANREARRVLKEHDEDAMVGANPLILGIPTWIQNLMDYRAIGISSLEHLASHGHSVARRTAAKKALHSLLGPIPRILSFLPTVLAADWWNLGLAGKLAHFICPADCVHQMDFVGFDYYWGIRPYHLQAIHRLLDAGMGRFDLAPVWCGALERMLKRYQKLFPHLPLVIVENGSVVTADGVSRALYLEQHIQVVEQAVAKGVDVAAYVCWSITTNREWGLPTGPGTDFGLYHVDLDNDPELRRQPTPAAETYRRLIAASPTRAARPTSPGRAARPG
ncbi:MAG: glycoside hydrolase family 1 protein [Chloroflexi bacterium]|nr:MAG: glycoside hydrolase family 1 protein [Chloroflexota bacterium]